MIRLLEMTSTASVLIIIIIIARTLLIHRVPKNVFKALWIVVILRLLLPFSFALPNFSPLFVPNLAEIDVVKSDGAATAMKITESVNGAITLQNVISVVWCCGAVLVLSIFVFSYVRMKKTLSEALPLQNDEVIPKLKLMKTKRKVRIKLSDRIASPMTYGIINPVILLPKNLDLSEEKRVAFIIAHEMIHIRRFDVLYKAVLTVAACLHWFNPLVWLMYFLVNRDIELACDEAVIRQFDGERAEYAMTLIKLEEKRSNAFSLGFSTNAASERITAIMKFGKNSIIGMILAFSLFLGSMTFAVGGGGIFGFNFFSPETDTVAEPIINSDDSTSVSKEKVVSESAQLISCTKITDSGLNYNAMLDITPLIELGITVEDGKVLYKGEPQSGFTFITREGKGVYSYSADSPDGDYLTIVQSANGSCLISGTNGDFITAVTDHLGNYLSNYDYDDFNDLGDFFGSWSLDDDYEYPELDSFEGFEGYADDFKDYADGFENFADDFESYADDFDYGADYYNDIAENVKKGITNLIPDISSYA